MAILSKGLKPDNKVHSSLELGLTNIRGLCSNFVECQSFSLNQTPGILALCETSLDNSNLTILI